MDHYTLVFEAIPNEETGFPQARAVATNTATQSTAEAQLSTEQTRSLLAHAYGGEQSIIDDCLEHIEAGHTVELLATGKDLCVFTSQELVRFGFDPDDLEM